MNFKPLIEKIVGNKQSIIEERMSKVDDLEQMRVRYEKLEDERDSLLN